VRREVLRFRPRRSLLLVALLLCGCPTPLYRGSKERVVGWTDWRAVPRTRRAFVSVSRLKCPPGEFRFKAAGRLRYKKERFAVKWRADFFVYHGYSPLSEYVDYVGALAPWPDRWLSLYPVFGMLVSTPVMMVAATPPLPVPTFLFDLIHLPMDTEYSLSAVMKTRSTYDKPWEFALERSPGLHPLSDWWDDPFDDIWPACYHAPEQKKFIYWLAWFNPFQNRTCWFRKKPVVEVYNRKIYVDEKARDVENVELPFAIDSTEVTILANGSRLSSFTLRLDRDGNGRIKAEPLVKDYVRKHPYRALRRLEALVRRDDKEIRHRFDDGVVRRLWKEAVYGH